MIDFKALADSLLARSRELLVQWLPAGKFRGHEYQVGNLMGDAGESLSINANSGAWKDFASGDAGGDLISLYAAINSLSQGDAAVELANGDFRVAAGSGAPPPRRADPPSRKVVAPVPDSMGPPSLKALRHKHFGVPSATWEYRDGAGKLLGVIARYDPPESRKQIVPYTVADTGRGFEWGPGQWPAPRPLYGLELLAANPTAPVIIVEGEKAADAARVIVQGRYVVVTWPGGSQAWKLVDWAPVSGRRILLWPDADKKKWDAKDRDLPSLDDVGKIRPPHKQPGMVAMVGIGGELAARCPEVKIIDVVDAPGVDGWDAADALADGWDWVRLVAFAKPRAKLIGDALETVPRETSSPPTPARRKVEGKGPPVAQERAQAKAPAKDKAKPSPPVFMPWEGRPWAAHLLCTDKGQPKPLVRNAIMALTMDAEWDGVLSHDVFAMQTVATKPPPINGGAVGPWSDVYDTLTAAWLQKVGIQVPPVVAAQAIEAVAHDSTFHPVRDYLETCAAKWDQTARADTWLIDFVGAKDKPYTRAIGLVFLLGAVARIFEPGCKFDTALILEGAQGKRKSMVFDVLGGSWFSDDLSELGSKDSKMEVAASWVMELAELSQMNRGDLDTTKAFITRRVDKFRLPYGRRVIDRPRQCVFGGTSNNSDYLKDDENRRFLPIRVGDRIDIEGLRRLRDQLWGEAVHRYKGGEKWWIEDPAILEAARGQQELRRQMDEWETLVVQYLDGQPLTPIVEVTVGVLLEKAIGLPKERWSQPDQNRVVRALKRLGWELGWRRESGARVKCYRRPLSDRIGLVPLVAPLTPTTTVDKFAEFEE